LTRSDAKKQKKYDFSKETIKKRRAFPTAKTILLVCLVVLQVICVLGIIFYNPSPQDVIEKYNIYVTPNDDGSLNIDYSFTSSKNQE
jgi:hypothetical protein